MVGLGRGKRTAGRLRGTYAENRYEEKHGRKCRVEDIVLIIVG
jgi:hypothetical protein